MKTYKITNFSGRTGNNLLQTLTMLYEFERDVEGVALSIPPHSIFSLKTPYHNANKYNSCTYDTLQFLQLNINTLKTLSDKYLKFHIQPTNIIYDIGIHIRSGDIFQNNGHRLYKQPPLNMYKRIIDDNMNKNIVIVFENNNNPVINELKRLYHSVDNIYFQSSTLLHDINTLSNCKTLVISNGTFCLIPMMYSNFIDKIVYPSYMKNNKWFRFDDNCISFDLPNYNTEWNNSKEQNQYLLSYEL